MKIVIDGFAHVMPGRCLEALLGSYPTVELKCDKGEEIPESSICQETYVGGHRKSA